MILEMIQVKKGQMVHDILKIFDANSGSTYKFDLIVKNSSR